MRPIDELRLWSVNKNVYSCFYCYFNNYGVGFSAGINGGPSVYDRVLAVNVFGTKTVLLLSVIAFLYGRPDFLDLALAYALVNMVGVLAVLEYFQNRVRKKSETQDD